MPMPNPSPLRQRVRQRAAQLVRAWDGPMTRDLVQRPGAFGLGRVPERLTPDATTQLTCGYCSTGCSLTAHLREGSAVNLSADPLYPVNLGMACPKGWEALAPLDAPDRATRPLLRGPDGVLRPVDWDTAMGAFVGRFKAIQAAHGLASVAFISTGQIVTEEMAFLGALAKFGMGMVHGDGNTRQCMATAASAYKHSFGFDAPPGCYADFEESDAIILLGSNLCIAHPIMWQRVLRNRRSPEIVVIDPRRTETAQCATQHVALAPKSDLTLLFGLAHLLVRAGWVKRDYIAAHTTGFAAFEEFVGAYAPERVSRETGVSVAELERLAHTIGTRERVSFWWTMGINQSHEGVRTAQAIINLALMTGNIGRPGTGANSITGQCNAMGSRLFSNTVSLFGGRSFTDPADRADVARILEIEEARIPTENSLAYDQILAGIDDGTIRGLWIIATNPAHSWIHQSEARARLRKLDFLVVQDLYADTETAREAHLVLPAAGWGEKDGTFINSERRLGVVRKIRRAPGEALADFHIFQLVAHHWGCGDLFRAWRSPADVFEIMKRLSAGRPCDLSGIHDYAQLDLAGGLQWPVPEGASAPAAERRLFADGVFYTPDGRARFVCEESRPAPEMPDADFPFWLLSGRGTSAQWHTQTRTGRSAVLRKLHPATTYLELNPTDARRLGIADAQEIRVISRRGRLTATACVTAAVAPGQVFLPMHYAETNRLTFPAFDPHSRQPSYKAGAVRIEAI